MFFSSLFSLHENPFFLIIFMLSGAAGGSPADATAPEPLFCQASP
jgi:hypothetical protein